MSVLGAFLVRIYRHLGWCWKTWSWKIVNTETFHGMIRNSWMLFNIDKVFPINMTFDKIFQNIWSLKLGISLKTRFQLLKTFPLIFVKLTSILKHKKTDTPSWVKLYPLNYSQNNIVKLNVLKLNCLNKTKG